MFKTPMLAEGYRIISKKRYALLQHAINSLLIIFIIPVTAHIGPARHVSLTTKISDLSEVPSPTFILLPLTYDRIVRRAD
jgi:hypothetical protein